ncbi:hypothetical protein [Paraliomyxa miuraensis]|uniref:hypothetical protein n=1 Tax=Paraliomyxa miuraensis TaxID=376150 RepID=UPI00224FA2EE|nr:hypothetical protein [Paraliomyxa miuraensis]MCX4240675.1 hypothetical protein [Paraliomyxa miuraensis]
MDDDAEARRRARSSWPIRRFELGAEPSDDLSATTTVEQRLAMMWPLAVRAWTLAGREIPRYARSEMPGRIIRPPASEAS